VGLDWLDFEIGFDLSESKAAIFMRVSASRRDRGDRIAERDRIREIVFERSYRIGGAFERELSPGATAVTICEKWM